jgi:tetratricopeptide (TPR) repeat protein/predicted aspartyl protease
MDRRRAIILFLLLGAATARGADDCKLMKFGELPATFRGSRALVDASINGQPVQLMIDSGAFFSSLTRESAARLNLRLGPLPGRMIVRGVGGVADTSLATAKEFTLAGLNSGSIKNVDFIVFDNRMAGEADGLLGENLLGFADTEYDLGNGVIRLMKAKDCGKQSLVYWDRTAPFGAVHVAERTAWEPHILGSATLNGKAIRVMFDSGSWQSILTAKAAERAGITPGSPGVTAGGSIGGLGARSAEGWIGRFASLNLGGEEIRNIGLRFAKVDLGDGADLLLGMDFFRSHRIYVSKSQNTLYFTYNGGQVFDLSVLHDSPTAATAAEGNDEPHDAEGFKVRGTAYAARRQFDLAFADYDRAVALAPDDPRNYYDRATAHLQNGQPVLAMDDLDHALRLKPDDVPSLMLRGQLRLTNQDKEGAAGDFAAVRRLAPADASSSLQIAQIYTAARDYVTAIAAYDRWIGENPRDARLSGALNARCRSRAALNRDLDLALADCDQSIAKGADTSHAYDSRGLVHLRRGELVKALMDYTKALKLQPKSASALYGLGLTELRQGNRIKGEVDVQAAKALDDTVEAQYKEIGLLP